MNLGPSDCNEERKWYGVICLFWGQYTAAMVRVVGFVGIDIAVICIKSVGLTGIEWCIRDVFIIIAVP